MVKFLRNVGFLSLLTSSVFAQDIPPKNQNDLITICTGGTANKICETKKNGKIARKIFYQDGILVRGSVYYASGRTAKDIQFNKGMLQGLFITPDQSISKPHYDFHQEYQLSFKNGKFLEIFDMVLDYFWAPKKCKEDTPNGTKCDELNYFYPSSEPGLHPVLALPIENQGLDVLKSNGIKMP